MGKQWLIAKANLRKTKSVSITLGLIFLIAALMLNAGLLVSLNYGSFFQVQKEQLKPSDAYMLMQGNMYTEEVEDYFAENKNIKELQVNDGLALSPEILSQGKMRDYYVIFRNMEEELKISKWKYTGEHIPVSDLTVSDKTSSEKMPVYLPHVFNSVSGYELNDEIKLHYKDSSNKKQIMTFTVKGYTEDIYFTATNTMMMGFYLPEETYKKVEKELDSPMFDAKMIFMNLNDPQGLTKVENGFRDLLEIDSSLMPDGDASQLLISLDREMVESSRTFMAVITSMMLVVFAFIIVLVCLLVMRFRISNSIDDDMMKIGSLKSVGYTSPQITGSILLQFMLIAGIGSIFGIALSYPILPKISQIFEQQSGLKWEQGFDPGISFSAFFGILSVTLLISLLAAKRLKKISPVNALRGETSVKKYSHNRIPLEKSIGSLPVTLAFKHTLQGLKQSLMIFVIVAAVCFVGVYGVIMYYNTSADTSVFATVPGMELCNASATLNPDKDNSKTVREIREMQNVSKAQFVDAVSLEVEGFQDTADIMTDFSGKETNLIYEGHYPQKAGDLTLAGTLAEKTGKKIGDRVSVTFGDETKEFMLVGLANGSTMGGTNINILARDYRELNPDFKQISLYIYLDEGTDAAEFIKKLRRDFDENTVTSIMNFDKELEKGMSVYQNIVAAMGITMLVITLFVIALVLYFVIGSSVIRRKRELGIHKAIGFTTMQLMNQISVGFAIPMILGVIVGSLLGAVYTNPMMSVLMRTAGIMKANFIVDPMWVALFALGTFLFAYLLSLLVTARIKRISPYALATE